MEFFLIVFLYMYIPCRWISSYQEGRVGIPLTGLTPQQLCACPNPVPGSPTIYVVVTLVFFNGYKVRGDCSFC